MFDSGSRATVAIILLVRQPDPIPAGGGTISYHDIGDYLSREEKLAAVAGASIGDLPWERITPNEQHDWLNQRDDRYGQLVPLAGEPGAVFHTGSRRLITSRDAWVYNSSEPALRRSVGAMIRFYNDHSPRSRPSQWGNPRQRRSGRPRRKRSSTRTRPGSVGTWVTTGRWRTASDTPFGRT